MQGDRLNHHVERTLMIYDTNGDGTIGQAEVAAKQKRIFGAVDGNGDGKLSVGEFRRRGRLIMRAGGATLFDMLDVNGDQQVTVEELHGSKARWLKRYNTDDVEGLGADELAGGASKPRAPASRARPEVRRRAHREPSGALGGIEVQRALPLSLTFDHRPVNGGEATGFLAAMIADLARVQ